MLSGNFHGGTVVASYPFDDSKTHKSSGIYSKSADDEVFKYLAKAYASNHPIMKTGTPNCPGEEKETFKDGITNGAQWYDVEGRLLNSLGCQLIDRSLSMQSAIDNVGNKLPYREICY